MNLVESEKKDLKDYSISFVRFVSMLFIVLCHVLQYYDKELCWWFNIGVQIFFLLSGYLYCNKILDTGKCIIDFYCKNLIKIFIDYYIWIGLLSFILYFFYNTTISTVDICNIILLRPIAGLEHLWFIKYILVCYLITPILVFFVNFIKQDSKVYIIGFIAGCIFISIVMKQFNLTTAWINCYFIGMFLRNLNLICVNNYKKILFFIAVFGINLNLLQIFLQYRMNIDLYNIKNGHYINEYGHVFLAVICFYLLKSLYRRLSKYFNLKKGLDISDKYSYDVYLTHHSYILGPYTMLNISGTDTVIKLILAILLSTYFVKLLSLKVQFLIQNWGNQNVKMKDIFSLKI